MFVAVRKYKNAGSASAIAEAVHTQLVPVLKQDPGFKGFYVMDCGDGIITSISVFESKEAAQRSNEQAKAARANFSSLLPDDPEIVMGETVLADTP